MGADDKSIDARLTVSLVIAASILLLELVGGFLTNSLALISDAGHVLVDLFAISLSLFAVRVGRRSHTPSLSYGYHRTEILASFVNGIILAGVSLYIFAESFRRILAPQEVQGGLLLIIAMIGLLGNIMMLALLRGGVQGSLNVKGAYLHVLGDTLSSIGVLAAGVIMLLTDFFLIDPIIAAIIGAITLRNALILIKESSLVLMERVPRGFDLQKINMEIMNQKGVKGIHELHIWTLSSSLYLLSGHLVIEDQKISQASELLKRIDAMLKEKYGIGHTTIQLESESLTLLEVRRSKDSE